MLVGPAAKMIRSEPKIYFYALSFHVYKEYPTNMPKVVLWFALLSGVPDYFDRNKISSGGDLSHYSSASLY